jgi:predicted porin
MKKSLIALAVAGAMTAPVVAQADATLYGKFEMRLKSVTDQDLNLESDDFRVGLKGDVDLGLENTKGIFGYETEINPEANNDETAFNDTYDAGLTARKAFVGATGGWGTVLAGRFANPAEAVIGYTDNLSEDTYADLNPDHLGAALAYVTPTVSGLSGYVAAVMEGEGNDTNSDADGYLVGADYAMGGLNLSVAYWDVNSDYSGTVADWDYLGVGASYTFGATTLGATYQERDENGTDNEIYGVKVSHTIDALTLAANYHEADDEAASGFDNQYSLSAVYALGSRAALDAEFVSTERAAGDRDTFSVAYTLKF